MSEESARTVELRDYLEILWRRKWIIVIALTVVVATGVFRSARQTKIYQATGEILVAVETEDEVLTQVSIIEGQAIRQKVAEKVPGAGRASSSGGNGRIVTIAVEDSKPTRAAEAVSAYIGSYIEYRQEQRLKQLLSTTEQTRARADELRVQVDQLTTELDEKSAEIDARALPVFGETAGEAAARNNEVNRRRRELEGSLKVRRDALQRDQLQLESTLFELSAASNVTEPVAEVVNEPAIPDAPVRPDPLSAGISAAVFGLILGIALTFLFEYLDESIKTKEDIARAVGSNVPVAATIPSIVEWRDRATPEVVSLSAPRSPAAEAYRSLRTSVQFAGLEEPINALAITSPTAGEGKTTALANLAVAVAAAGRRVVILDCDLRRPRIHSFFGLSNEVGFTSWIIGRAPLSAAVQEVPGIRRLSLMASGPIPPNPSELLSSRRFPELVKALQADGALVLIDTPPLLPVTDAAVIARSIDAVFMVTMAGKGTRRHLRQAMDILQQVDAPLTGIVLNGVDADHYSYAYQSTYYGEPQPAPPPLLPARRQATVPPAAPAASAPAPSGPAQSGQAQSGPAQSGQARAPQPNGAKAGRPTGAPPTESGAPSQTPPGR